jgi:hypothetical protein
MIVISGEALVDLTGSRFDHVDAYVPKLAASSDLVGGSAPARVHVRAGAMADHTTPQVGPGTMDPWVWAQCGGGWTSFTASRSAWLKALTSLLCSNAAMAS